MLTRYVGLVNESGEKLSSRLLSKVGAALQKQVSRDFAPIWEISASVHAFATLDDLPIGYWPVILVNDVQGAAGVHLDEQGQPYALVELGDQWSLTASHETLEMLADPFGNRLIAGPSLKAGQGRVEYLVEVCDPSEAGEYSYTVNGIRVSDFYTPRFFDPSFSAGARYSFSGAISKPREVLQGGYISWHEPVSDHWWQQLYFGAKPEFRDLGKLTAAVGSLRSSLRALVDATTPQARAATRRVPSPHLASLRAAQDDSDASSASKARSLRSQIQALTKAKPAGE